MSSSGENNRWRNSNSHRQQPSRGGSGANTPTQSSTRQVNYSQAATSAGAVAAAPPTTNAWTDRSRSTSAARTPVQPQPLRPTTASPGANGASATPPTKRQGAINNFNNTEVKEMFKQGYRKLAGPDALKATYRPTGDAAARKNGNAWGSKPSSMAGNGPDFFIHLRKLVETSERGEHGRGG